MGEEWHFVGGTPPTIVIDAMRKAYKMMMTGTYDEDLRRLERAWGPQGGPHCKGTGHAQVAHIDTGKLVAADVAFVLFDPLTRAWASVRVCPDPATEPQP